MMNSINKLLQISLNKSAFESVEEHIDELIQNEKSEHQQGWQYRITILEIMKQQKKFIESYIKEKIMTLKIFKNSLKNLLMKKKIYNNISKMKKKKKIIIV